MFHMTQQQAETLIDMLHSKWIIFTKGLSPEELAKIDDRFGIRFPPDLQLLLQTALPVSKGFYNWREALVSQDAEKNINEALQIPWQGIRFDIEHNDFWYAEWGNKPEQITKRVEVAAEHFPGYPLLIPVYIHRYMPAEPQLPGNPVFSVHQTDIIYYGPDLASYLATEFGFTLPDDFQNLKEPLHRTRFWSSMVEDQ